MNWLTLAHAGHGHTEGTSLMHYLVEPAHMPYSFALLAVVLGVIGYAIFRKRREV